MQMQFWNAKAILECKSCKIILLDTAISWEYFLSRRTFVTMNIMLHLCWLRAGESYSWNKPFYQRLTIFYVFSHFRMVEIRGSMALIDNICDDGVVAIVVRVDSGPDAPAMIETVAENNAAKIFYPCSQGMCPSRNLD